MGFRAKRPGALEEVALNRSVTESASRGRALPTKNTFIEFPVSVGQLGLADSPVGDGLRPYTTPAWLQTDVAASLEASLGSAPSPRLDPRAAADCCTRTPSPSAVREPLPDVPALFAEPGSPGGLDRSTSYLSDAGGTPLDASSQPFVPASQQAVDGYGDMGGGFAPQFVYTVPAFDTQGSGSSASAFDGAYVPQNAFVEQAAWG